MFGRKISLLCLLLLLISTAAQAKIVFSSERNGVRGVYVMDDDGSNQTLLTESKELRPFPNCWSPDGKQIAFQRRLRVNGDVAVFLMDPDGTNVRKLIEDGGGYIGIVSFSPDGKYIVFNRTVRVDNKSKYSITVLNIETGKMKEIADTLANFCDWSPDGKSIVFAEAVAVGGAGSTIWIIGADGRNRRKLIPTPGIQADNFVIHRSRPRWSPDGKQIVFTEMEHKWEFVPNVGNARFFRAYRYMICNRDGTNIKKLDIPEDWRCYGIDWMDDGKSVVFSAREGMPLNEPIHGPIEFPPCYIYKYHIPTRVRTQLTDDPGWDQIIDWISDDVLPVTPRDKKKVTWGTQKSDK